MKGIELAKAYYQEYGKPMLEKEFPQYINRMAIGLVGQGSECYGFDDEISKDHDFEAGFCIWLTEEDERLFGFKLFRAYSKLPQEFLGVKLKKSGALGSDRKGVRKIKDFYSFYTGTGDVPISNEHWLSIPDKYLAEATNGEVFVDNLGEFSRIREKIKTGMPEDVRLKKLASAVFNMAQSGQYNYSRCLSHQEKAAAAIALSEFATNATQAVFLLNRKHMPYYKWAFRSMKELGYLSEISNMLELLLSSPYDSDVNTELIEKICSIIIKGIKEEKLSDTEDDYLEPYAYCINNKIKDGNLRNSPVML
ncbi:MAG TPA: DUF4037 domain-containing protein [Clostridia bacterium]|nr:DUF4037 domain-containing protein [Clostridia bacterium]